MTTTTRTPEQNAPEAEIMAAFQSRMAFIYGDDNCYAEVPMEGHRFDLVVSMVVGSDELLHACHGKAQLDDTVIEQARLSQGVSDLASVVVTHPKRTTDEFRQRIAKCEQMGLGVYLVQGQAVRERVQPRQNPNAQPDLLRAAIASRHSGQGTAGAKHGQVTKDAAWLREVEREAALDCGLPLRHLNLRTGRFHKSNRLAVGALRNAIREGQTTACIKDYPTETLVEVER